MPYLFCNLTHHVRKACERKQVNLEDRFAFSTWHIISSIRLKGERGSQQCFKRSTIAVHQIVRLNKFAD